MEPAARSADEDLRELRERFSAAGYYSRPAARVLCTWVGLLALGTSSLAPFALDWPWPLRAAGLIASGYGLLAAATIAHTASHGVLSHRRWINDLVVFVSYPFALMLSATYWHDIHIVSHHPAPNVLGRDADCDLRPFATNERHAAGGAWPRRLMNRVQGWLLPAVVVANGFKVQAVSWRHLLRTLARRPSDKRAWVDLACMTLHGMVWIGLPAIWFGLRAAALVYALRIATLGFGLFAVLTPGHYVAAARCLDERALQHDDVLVRVTATTVNYRTGWLGHLLCSGIEFHIEHHLFPGISHVHLPAMSETLRSFCEERGLPHRTLGWGRAVWESWRIFFHPKPVHASLQDLPEYGERARGRPFAER
jgi:fatty acid desaturase